MKYLFMFLLVATAMADEPTCKVQICNRIERFSLNPFSHLKDKWGENCFDTSIPKTDAVENKILNTESRWYQGKTWNPTKKSVTRVKKVYSCG